MSIFGESGAGDNTVVLTHLPFDPATARKLASLLELSHQMGLRPAAWPRTAKWRTTRS